MAETRATRSIQAPVETVFDAVAHIEKFSEAVDNITDVEFLTETHRGVGTRFRETRLMKGREATTELEVTEYIENESIRLVSDEGGTVWDTVFTTTPVDDGTQLAMVMDARPYKFAAKVVNPLIGRMISKAVESDLDAVKTYCEAAGS